MADEREPSFEDALTRVERIVEDLERGEPSLSTALAKYEDGVQLLRRCYTLLDQAERSVALLTGVDEHGNPSTIPFDATATLGREAVATPAEGTPTRPRDRASTARAGAAGGDPEDGPGAPF